MDAEISLVDFLRPSRFVCEEFPIEGSLRKVPTFDRHGSPVGFKEEIHPLALPVLIRVFQGGHAIGADTEFNATLNFHPPPKRLPFAIKRKLVLVEQSDIATFLAGEFKRYHHLGNEKCVLKIFPADRTVLLTPRNGAHGDAKFMLQECPSFVP